MISCAFIFINIHYILGATFILLTKKNAFLLNMDYFVNKIFPVVVFILGSIGNLTGIGVLSRKSMRKMSMVSEYQYLLASDTFYFIHLPIVNLIFSYPHLDPVAHSVWFCKLFIYADFAFANLSPMLLIYISLERLVAIKYPTKRFILKKKKNILIFCFLVTVFNMFFYVEAMFYFNIETKNATSLSNETYSFETCIIRDAHQVHTLAYMYLVESTLVPYVLMVICTSVLCYIIFKSRITLGTVKNKRRDLKYTVTSISLNMVFIILTLPISLTNFSITSSNLMPNLVFIFTDYLFFSSYGVNFYLLLIFNSTVRREFFLMFHRKSRQVKQLMEKIQNG